MKIEIVRPDIVHDSYVQARNSLENRGFFYCPNYIDDALKQHDEELALWRNERTNKYRITGDNLWTIMEVDGREVYSSLVERVKRIDSRAGYSAIAELRKSDEARERANTALTEDIAYNLAKDTRKAVNSLNY